MMTKRTFLKTIGTAASAMAVAPSLALSAKPNTAVLTMVWKDGSKVVLTRFDPVLEPMDLWWTMVRTKRRYERIPGSVMKQWLIEINPPCPSNPR